MPSLQQVQQELHVEEAAAGNLGQVGSDAGLEERKEKPYVGLLGNLLLYILKMARSLPALNS